MRDISGRPDLVSINTATLGFTHGLDEIILKCHEQGIGAIAPWIREFDQPQKLKQIKKQLQSTGIKISGLCRSDYYTSDNSENLAKALDSNRRHLDLAAEINARCFVQVVGSLAGGSKDLGCARKQVKHQLAKLLDHSKQVGVPLALEPLHPMTTADRSCLNSLRQAVKWCEELDPDNEYNLGIALDVYHTWWDPDLFKLIEKAGKRILGYHVSDWLVDTCDLVNDRGLPGEGVIDLKSIRKRVEATGYKGFIEIEVFTKRHFCTLNLDEKIKLCKELVTTNC